MFMLLHGFSLHVCVFVSMRVFIYVCLQCDNVHLFQCSMLLLASPDCEMHLFHHDI